VATLALFSSVFLREKMVVFTAVNFLFHDLTWDMVDVNNWTSLQYTSFG
jgi:hypothetical protein